MAVVDQQDYDAEIGWRLRAVRQQQDRTLDEVEACSGGRLTGAAVGSWERRQLRGDRSPAITLRRDDPQKLAGLLGVTVGQLLAGLDGKGPPDGGEHPTPSRSQPHVVIDLDISADQTSASEGRR